MTKINIRINGETVGACSRINVKETRSYYSLHGDVGGSVEKFKTRQSGWFKKFLEDIRHNIPMKLEFEDDNYIWKASHSYIESYNCITDPDDPFVMIMEDLNFRCASLELIQKDEIAVPKTKQDMTTPELVNKFTAAISNYYKKGK